MPRLKDPKAEQNKLRKSLVSTYGEGAVIPRNELIDFRNKKHFAASVGFIISSNLYKVFRGHYIVTQKRDPQGVREAIKKAKDRLRSPHGLQRKPVNA